MEISVHPVLILAASLLFASVGQARGSGYQAPMTLLDVANMAKTSWLVVHFGEMGP
jgi:hypothetical protein